MKINVFNIQEDAYPNPPEEVDDVTRELLITARERCHYGDPINAGERLIVNRFYRQVVEFQPSEVGAPPDVITGLNFFSSDPMVTDVRRFRPIELTRLLVADTLDCTKLFLDDGTLNPLYGRYEDGPWVVCIEQFRVGSCEVTLEVPGGMVDPGETPRCAAERELREETGYVAREWKQIGVIDPNPAIQNNRTYTFLAIGAEQKEEPQFDATEQCRVVLAPWVDTPRLVAEGDITHALVVVGLHFETLRRSGL